MWVPRRERAPFSQGQVNSPSFGVTRPLLVRVYGSEGSSVTVFPVVFTNKADPMAETPATRCVECGKPTLDSYTSSPFNRPYPTP